MTELKKMLSSERQDAEKMLLVNNLLAKPIHIWGHGTIASYYSPWKFLQLIGFH